MTTNTELPGHIIEQLTQSLADAESLERAISLVKWQMLLHGQQHTGMPPDDLLEEEAEAGLRLEHALNSIYLWTVFLLDTAGLHRYLRQFYERFGRKFDRKAAASKFDSPHPDSYYNVVLSDLRVFLEPFNLRAGSGHQLRGRRDVAILERVLRNTALFIQDLAHPPASEAELDRAMRRILERLFPGSAKAPSSRFIKTHKYYKPDLLIPELGAAIEYKYIDSEIDLKTHLGQLAEDAHAYSDDPQYHLFYAVVFITYDFAGQEHYDHAWKEFKMSDNWVAFYIDGRPLV